MYLYATKVGNNECRYTKRNYALGKDYVYQHNGHPLAIRVWYENWDDKKPINVIPIVHDDFARDGFEKAFNPMRPALAKIILELDLVYLDIDDINQLHTVAEQVT